MMTRRNTSICLMALGLLSIACSCGAVDLMQGKMVAVPVPYPGRVKIDGDLSDWDLSGQEWFCISPETADKFHGTRR